MRRQFWSGLILALGASAPSGANAAEWQTQSFELRLDRLYFPAGEESLIFEDAPFVILRTDDTIYAGFIEHAWEGVSVSEPAHGFFDTIPTDDLSAIVQPAELDTTRPINVGSELPRLSVRAGTDTTSRTEWSDYNPIDPLREDFLSGALDAIVTLTDFDPHPSEVKTISESLPYVAVLIPNIRRDFNYHGELTTSLYYRFNTRHLAVCFRGDEADEVRRFTTNGPGLFQLPRWYDFDPTRGKKLFDRMSQRPSRVRLFSGHPVLDGLTRYFADILSRDRCAVELRSDPASSDITIMFIPFSDSLPRMAADSLYAAMVRDSVAGSPPAEYLRRIGLELRGLDIALQPTDSLQHFEAIDRILAEDLGVFPLFRPTLFVHTQKRLRGVTLRADGLVDFGAAVFVRLPQNLSGGQR